MADQDWKVGGLNKGKYIIVKPGEATKILFGRAYLLEGVEAGGQHKTESSPAIYEDRVDVLNAKRCELNAQYFVLRIDCVNGEPLDPHARVALRAYADSVERENSQLAGEINDWLSSLGGEGVVAGVS